jgi:hypothetical protein
MARAHYLLDNQQSEAGQRFDALGTLFNPSTFRHMGSMGLSPGWRVWEVGAGAAMCWPPTSTPPGSKPRMTAS